MMTKKTNHKKRKEKKRKTSSNSQQYETHLNVVFVLFQIERSQPPLQGVGSKIIHDGTIIFASEQFRTSARRSALEMYHHGL